jgi:hypothetical protein
MARKSRLTRVAVGIGTVIGKADRKAQQVAKPGWQTDVLFGTGPWLWVWDDVRHGSDPVRYPQTRESESCDLA